MKCFFIAVFVTCSPALGIAQATGATASADTVIRFEVASRTWTWPYLLAHVGVSCRGGEVVAGTTTAPDTAEGRERYCAGATIEMRNSTLMLRGARGVVHVRINRVPADSMRQPRR